MISIFPVKGVLLSLECLHDLHCTAMFTFLDIISSYPERAPGNQVKLLVMNTTDGGVLVTEIDLKLYTLPFQAPVLSATRPCFSSHRVNSSNPLWLKTLTVHSVSLPNQWWHEHFPQTKYLLKVSQMELKSLCFSCFSKASVRASSVLGWLSMANWQLLHLKGH